MSAKNRYFNLAMHGCNPIRPNSHTIGHQFVKADWNRFKPTKAFNASQYGLCSHANETLASTTIPAIRRNPRSIVISVFLSIQEPLGRC